MYSCKIFLLKPKGQIYVTLKTQCISRPTLLKCNLINSEVRGILTKLKITQNIFKLIRHIYCLQYNYVTNSMQNWINSDYLKEGIIMISLLFKVEEEKEGGGSARIWERREDSIYQQMFAEQTAIYSTLFQELKRKFWS